MKEKIRETIYKLKSTIIVASTASLHYNIHLIKKVYFGCGVLSLMLKQEEELKKIYEPVALRKLELSKNFLRAVLYFQKTALGVGCSQNNDTCISNKIIFRILKSRA